MRLFKDQPSHFLHSPFIFISQDWTHFSPFSLTTSALPHFHPTFVKFHLNLNESNMKSLLYDPYERLTYIQLQIFPLFQIFSNQAPLFQSLLGIFAFYLELIIACKFSWLWCFDLGPRNKFWSGGNQLEHACLRLGVGSLERF